MDAARQLAEKATEADLWDNCGGHLGCYCCKADSGADHESDCPVPAFPRIVAALEAAERVSEIVPGSRLMPTHERTGRTGVTEAQDAIQALVVAMQGEEVKA